LAFDNVFLFPFSGLAAQSMNVTAILPASFGFVWRGTSFPIRFMQACMACHSRPDAYRKAQKVSPQVKLLNTLKDALSWYGPGGDDG
jgi:hypothetical protein